MIIRKNVPNPICYARSEIGGPGNIGGNSVSWAFVYHFDPRGGCANGAEARPYWIRRKELFLQ